MTYNSKKKYKETSESRRSHHTYLTRPDGSLLSEKDCLIFDLFTHFTKDGRVATSTYEWLLKEKFPRQNHPITVKRTCDNLSNYFKVKFKQKQIIDGKVHFHKLRIERVVDFDLKIAEAKQLFISEKCRQLPTQMSIATNTNVDSSTPSTLGSTKAPEPPIKNTIKSTINDNHDYQHNQFQISKNFSSESVETEEAKIATSEIVENSESWLAKEECQAIPEAKKQAAEFVEKPESLKGTQDITSYYQKPKTVEVKGKDGKMYNALPLEHLRLEEGMLQASISKSNKPNYATSRVKVIIRNILEKKPETLIFGGRKGAINYLVKAIDGERDYEYEYKYPPAQEEKALSMAEISNMKRIQLEKELVKNEIKWF